MNPKRIEHAIFGAIVLLLGWGLGTLVHEGGHLLAARALNLPATLGQCTLTTGSVFVHGSMTDAQTTIIALAGSLGLVIAGVLLVRLSRDPALRMIGVVFLCRAWADALPITGFDGGIIAGSAGYGLAVLIVVAEVVICGNVIMDVVQGTRTIN